VTALKCCDVTSATAFDHGLRISCMTADRPLIRKYKILQTGMTGLRLTDCGRLLLGGQHACC